MLNKSCLELGIHLLAKHIFWAWIKGIYFCNSSGLSSLGFHKFTWTRTSRILAWTPITGPMRTSIGFFEALTCFVSFCLQYIPKCCSILKTFHLSVLPFPYFNAFFFLFWASLNFYKQQLCHVNASKAYNLKGLHRIIIGLNLTINQESMQHKPRKLPWIGLEEDC